MLAKMKIKMAADILKLEKEEIDSVQISSQPEVEEKISEVNTLLIYYF